MIDSKIKDFNEFEKVNEAFVQRDRTSYECYMIGVSMYKDDYNEGEETKAFYNDTISDVNYADYTLDGLLKKLSKDFSHYIPTPINKESSYYEAPIIRYCSPTVNRDCSLFNKQEEEAWKNGDLEGIVVYVDLYIRKCEDVPAAEALKLVGKP